MLLDNESYTDDYDMFIVFEMSFRLRQETGLKKHERNALKRLFDKLSINDQVGITKHLGTIFIDAISK